MTKFVAHRGDPIGYRENTLQAFQSAARLGAHMIELDIQRSRDGQCVILHDDTLNRLWNIDESVSDLTYAEIQSVTAQDEYIVPLLVDVVESIALPLMIDVKYAESVDAMVETLVRLKAVDRALIVGGNIEAHRRVRQLLPQVQIGLTWIEADLPPQSLLEELKVSYFNPPWQLLEWDHLDSSSFGADMVAEMHQRGLNVSVWTVDDVAEMWNLVHYGVDAIISNRCTELMTRYQANQGLHSREDSV